MTNQTYSITFTPRDFERALESTKEKSDLFLNSYHGDVLGNVVGIQKKVDWESGIARVMEQYDDAWRDLAHL